MKNSKNIKTLLTAFFVLVCGLLSGCLFQQPENTIAGHVDVAMAFDGCTDCSQLFLESVGLSGDHNYCAAFVSYSLVKTSAKEPSVRSGRAAHFVTSKSIEARHVIRGSYQVQRGDLIIWTQEYSHIGISIETWEGVRGRTIEGNTSPPALTPALSPGERELIRGVYVKERDFSPGSYFRPRYVTNVKF